MRNEKEKRCSEVDDGALCAAVMSGRCRICILNITSSLHENNLVK
jgi:hypothetical protein